MVVLADQGVDNAMALSSLRINGEYGWLKYAETPQDEDKAV